VTRELVKSAEIWSSGVARDLAQNVNKALQERNRRAPKVQRRTSNPIRAAASGGTRYHIAVWTYRIHSPGEARAFILAGLG
jgi:hypothetical protein